MRWKTLFGQCIYQSESGVRVFDNKNYRWLKFDSDAYQSLLYKKHPSKPVLNYIQSFIFLAAKKPGECLLLGLGGAAAVHALSPFLGSFPITAIEQSKEVIMLAKHYFMSNKLPNLRIIQDDANNFVKTSNKLVNHLLVDLFNENHFPAQCCTREFFAHCKHLLTEEGILAVNVANRHELKLIFALLRQEFGENTLLIPVKNCANVIIMAWQESHSKYMWQHLINYSPIKNVQIDINWGYIADFFV